MVSINTNLSSIISQKSLNKSINLLNQAIERMSTGYKVNHASDNAANYSISNDMTSKISSYMVAEDNTSMGLDMVNTAADTLDGVSERLSRIRSLAEQAANGTYGEDSMNAIKSEVKAHVDEIRRVMTNTEYNEMNIFDYRGVCLEDVDATFELITPEVVVTNPEDLQPMLDNYDTVGIANADVLYEFAQLVNSGVTCDGKTIVLTNDIDLSAHSTGGGWNPIGNELTPFQGVFTGNGYTISNLFIDKAEGNVGLFGFTVGAQIMNLTIKDCDVTGNSYTGGLVGHAEGGLDLFNCYVTGKVEGNVYVGGLVGWCGGGGIILNSYSSANISGGDSIGGLIGEATADVIQCYATGSVYSHGKSGGLAGSNDGVIKDCYATGNVTGESTVGGLVGLNNGEVSNCYATGDVTVVDGTGGLFGDNRGDVQRSTYVGTATTSGKVITDIYTQKDMTKATMQVGIYSGEDSQIGLKFRTVLSGLETISTRIGSSSVLDTIDGIISEVSSKQTELGAAQNRLESALESISVSYDNLVSSRSTLRDADIAKESSKYIQQQILQQAAATLLATANQSPSIALQLI